MSNTEAIGLVLYTNYLYFFQAAGLVLLVAMIGAIVLTLRHKEGVKRQNISEQVARTPATAIEIRKVQPGQGLLTNERSVLAIICRSPPSCSRSGFSAFS